MVHSSGDISIANDAGIIATVEVKNITGLDLPLALDLLDERIAPLAAGGPRYVMLISQDRGFLWKQSAGGGLRNAEVWELRMNELLAPYLRRIPPNVRLQHPELKLLISHWIGELTRGAVESAAESVRPLLDSGFLDAIRRVGVTAATLVA